MREIRFEIVPPDEKMSGRTIKPIVKAPNHTKKHPTHLKKKKKKKKKNNQQKKEAPGISCESYHILNFGARRLVSLPSRSRRGRKRGGGINVQKKEKEGRQEEKGILPGEAICLLSYLGRQWASQ